FTTIFFFFQAEDGIRDRNVTGVQTCALPIYYYSICRSALESSGRALGNSFAVGWHMDCQSSQAVRRTCLMFLNQRLGQREPIERSEERRVGKECRSRWWRCV